MEKSVPLKDGVYWVGAIDWNVREFYGYTTSRGTTYNAYLVRGEKTALVDTVKAGFFPEMFSRIESIMNPAETVMGEAAKYFGNILMPLVPLIPSLLKKVKKMGIPKDCVR